MAAPDDRALPDLRALRALVIVSEAGSLARGAVLANVPQSTISRQLATIEQQVGGPLFHRTGRGVKLTELGERFLMFGGNASGTTPDAYRRSIAADIPKWRDIIVKAGLKPQSF